MAGIGLINNLGIRTRVLLLTLVPLLILSLILGHYTVVTRISDLEQALRERGETIVRHLAAESEVALAFRDLQRLEELIAISSHGADVVRIVIRDANDDVLALSAPRHGARDPSLMTFTVPVRASPAVEREEAAAQAPRTLPERVAAGPADPVLGGIDLDMSRESTLLRQQSVIWSIVLLTSCAALFSVLVALSMGRGIVRPIVRLSKAVDGVRKGRLSMRVNATTGGELGALQQGFNAMAEAMESSQSRLRNEVRVATGRLQQTIEILEHRNRELDAARRKALAASEEKANFLANMSHEIRTPINAVLGYAALLEKSGLTLEQHEYARTISCASTQLLRVIDDILSLSRLESGTVQLDEADFDLRDAFEDVLCMMAPQARDKHLELVLIIDSDVPLKLVGDPARIGQIFINLLGNAIKFTERGGVTVHVMLAGLRGRRAEIEVHVIDTGIGIAPEALDKIFTSFHQADASISRRYGGSGLGLAIVSRLVQLWGGRVGVSSEPGKGSTFRFTFNCEVQQDAHPPAPEPGLAGRKILIYDDNPAALRAVRNLLLTWSVDVFLARTRDRIAGMLAEARAAGEPFELVIAGLHLEHAEDGGEPNRLVDTVRCEYALPLMLMVNCQHTSLLSRSLRDDGIKIVVKPLRRDILHRNLCALLGLHRYAPVPGARAEARSREFAGLRVLVAEDNDFNRDLVTRVLTSAGAAVTQAMTGDAALELARSQDFDIVIMDLHLPGMDGAETARRLRALGPDKRLIPIIALTADVFAQDRRGGELAEVDACLIKPLDESKLWRAIRRLCRRTPQNADAAAVPVPIAEIRERLQPRLIDSIAQQRHRLADAMAMQDLGALSELAHELRGVTGYFGLTEFSETVAEFERLARSGDLEEIGRQLGRIDAFIERLAPARAGESSAV